MTRYTQNREYKRVNSGSSLLYAYKNSKTFFSATVCSCHHDEMVFETGYEIEPGADIYLEIENVSQNVCGHDFPHQYKAMVRWCKPLPNKDAFFYIVGVKFYDPPPCHD